MKIVKNKICQYLSVFATFLILSTSSPVIAQVGVDYSEKNLTGSCDSTCTLSPKSDRKDSGLRTRVKSCPTGFTGSIIESSIIDQNGNWGTWTTLQDNCVCAPTYENSAGVCPAGQKGEVQYRRDWTCPTPKTGQWTAQYQTSNTCYSPCTPGGSETRGVNCPSGQTGSITQIRQSYCSGDDRAAPNWGAWTNLSSDCRAAVPATERISVNYFPAVSMTSSTRVNRSAGNGGPYYPAATGDFTASTIASFRTLGTATVEYVDLTGGTGFLRIVNYNSGNGSCQYDNAAPVEQRAFVYNGMPQSVYSQIYEQNSIWGVASGYALFVTDLTNYSNKTPYISYNDFKKGFALLHFCRADRGS